MDITNPNEITKEVEDVAKMIEYFGDNIDSIPALLQVSYMKEILSFGEKIKPLYVMALVLRGDTR